VGIDTLRFLFDPFSKVNKFWGDRKKIYLFQPSFIESRDRDSVIRSPFALLNEHIPFETYPIAWTMEFLNVQDTIGLYDSFVIQRAAVIEGNLFDFIDTLIEIEYTLEVKVVRSEILVLEEDQNLLVSQNVRNFELEFIDGVTFIRVSELDLHFHQVFRGLTDIRQEL
jgi:hypothetical protein